MDNQKNKLGIKFIWELILVLLFSYLLGLLAWQIVHKAVLIDDFFLSNAEPMIKNSISSIRNIVGFFVIFGVIGLLLRSYFLKISQLKIYLWMILFLVLAINFKNIIDNISIFHTTIFGLKIYNFIGGDMSWFWMDIIFICTFSYFFVSHYIISLIGKIKIPDKKYYIYILIFIAAVLYSLMSVFRHFKFGSNTMDLGGYDQMVWGFSQLKFLASTVYERGNLLGDHFEPIMMLISPIYWLWNNTYALLIFQAIWACIGALPIYLIAKKKLSSTFVALCFAFSYLFFIGFQTAIWFDFHPLVLVPTFLGFVFWFLEEKKYLWYWIMIFGALLCKETVSLYVFFIGLYVFFVRKERKLGLLTMALGIFWYIFAVKFIIGYLFHEKYGHISAYNNLGNGPMEIIKTIIANPLYALNTLFTPDYKIGSWFGLFASFAFLPFLAPEILIMALPMLGEKFLTISKDSLYVMWWHYSISIDPILAIATVYGLERVVNKFKKYNFDWLKAGGMVIVLATFTVAFIFYLDPPFAVPLGRMMKNDFFKLTGYNKEAYEVIKEIPETASVATQDTLLPHVSHRVGVYRIHPYVRSEAEYVLVDTSQGYWPYNGEEIMSLVGGLQNNPQYILVDEKGPVYLFRKK